MGSTDYSCYPGADHTGTMVSPENTNWLADYGLIDDVISVVPPPPTVFTWPSQPFPNLRVANNGSFGDLGVHKECGSKKRTRPESCGPSSSKACREKLRRDRLNDKFVELASILEPGRAPQTDKATILVDAVRVLSQLRSETQKLKDSTSCLQERIKELKVEKNELRDEKQKLKAEKEKLDQQLKTMNSHPGFLPPPPAIPAAYAAHGQAGTNKLVPVLSYPGIAMWQFMPPASVDTSEDHTLHAPVA